MPDAFNVPATGNYMFYKNVYFLVLITVLPGMWAATSTLGNTFYAYQLILLSIIVGLLFGCVTLKIITKKTVHGLGKQRKIWILISVIFATIFVSCVLNSNVSFQSPKYISAIILNKTQLYIKGGHSYDVEIKSQDNDQLSLQVEEKKWDSLNKGEQIRLKTVKGIFGFVIVSSILPLK